MHLRPNMCITTTWPNLESNKASARSVYDGLVYARYTLVYAWYTLVYAGIRVVFVVYAWYTRGIRVVFVVYAWYTRGIRVVYAGIRWYTLMCWLEPTEPKKLRTTSGDNRLRCRPPAVMTASYIAIPFLLSCSGWSQQKLSGISLCHSRLLEAFFLNLFCFLLNHTHQRSQPMRDDKFTRACQKKWR